MQRADETAPNQGEECLFVPQTLQWRAPRTLKLDEPLALAAPQKLKAVLAKMVRRGNQLPTQRIKIRHLGAARIGGTEPNGSMRRCCLGAISIAQPGLSVAARSQRGREAFLLATNTSR
jgi:hypothetical protein